MERGAGRRHPRLRAGPARRVLPAVHLLGLHRDRLPVDGPDQPVGVPEAGDAGLGGVPALPDAGRRQQRAAGVGDHLGGAGACTGVHHRHQEAVPGRALGQPACRRGDGRQRQHGVGR